MAVSVRMSRDEAWEMLRDAHTGIFTSLRADGVPISLPVWFAVLGEAIYISTRGKKLIRVGNDDRAAFLVEDGERWAELRAVHLTGRAEIIEPGEELAAAIAAEIRRKYSAYRAGGDMPSSSRKHYETAAGGIIRLVPDQRILNWDNNRLGLS
jgi:nitroimidazol reductase NimA-like FMN-containing flavoprotein (pyridoxamine 5'-phosphate oxidase superfamily)